MEKIFNVGDEVKIPKELKPFESLQIDAVAYVYQVCKHFIVFKLERTGTRITFSKKQCESISITHYADIIPEAKTLDDYRKIMRGK